VADRADSESKKNRETWRDDRPWLLLVGAFRVSIGLQVLVLAGIGAVATSAGWRVADKCFRTDSTTVAAIPYSDGEYFSKWPSHRGPPAESIRGSFGDVLGNAPSNPLVALPSRMVLPLLRMFQWDLGWGRFLYNVTGGFWTLLVWSATGTAIARVALVQLGREDRIEVISAVRFAQAKVPSVLGASVMPILGIAMLAIPIGALGLLMRTGIGAVLAGLLWPVVIIATGMMATILLGMLFGWPLVNVAIAAEGSDAFDGISRSYSYTFQRPLRYLGYALVSSAIGILGWLLVWGFSEAVIGLGYWSATWGLGREHVSNFATNPAGLSGLTWVGAMLIRFWVAVIRTLASGYGYSFFWCAMAGIYLLLRHDVDGTEWDHVYDDRSQGGIVYGLPKIDSSTASRSGAESPSTETA